MEENLEKKLRRPRISESRVDFNDHSTSYYSGENQMPKEEGEQLGRDAQENVGYAPRPQRGYGQRPQRGYGQRQGGYNNRYNNQGGYNRGYNPRYRQNNDYNRYNNYENNQYENNMPQAPQAGEMAVEGYQPQTMNNGGYSGYRQNNRAPRPYGNRQNAGGYGYNNNRPSYGRPAAPQMPRRKPKKKPKQQMRFTPRPKRIEYETPIYDPTEELRLNKFMANAGICSRREADEIIQKGLVTVNGKVASELGVKITRNDVVEYDGKVVVAESKCYILLNKPKDCVTTSDDPNGRKTVMDLVKGACEERIYPVGRLDRNTTGVLLLTNDGDLASKLTHPKYVKKKIYQVWTDRPISEDDMQHIADGVDLDDGPIHADAVSYVSANDKKQAGIEIHSGRNRIVRRIFESLGYHVVKLDRVYFAGLTKKNLPRGRWRYLTQEEVNILKQNSFE